MMRAWAARLTLALTVAAAVLVVTGAPGNALTVGDDDCNVAPPVQAPGAGVGGWFGGPTAGTIATDTADDAPAGGGRFTDDGTPRFSVYGVTYSTSLFVPCEESSWWETLLLGSSDSRVSILGDYIPDITTDPGPAIANTAANWMFGISRFAVGLVAATADAALDSDWMSAFDGLVTDTVTALKASTYDVWVMLFVALAGLGIVVGARHGRVAHAVTVVAFAIGVQALVTYVWLYPVTAAETVDDAIDSGVSAVYTAALGTDDSDDIADTIATSIADAVLWEPWKVAMFGRSNSTTAERYAQDVYEAQTFTWGEYTGGDVAALAEEKRERYQELSGDIADDDPEAFGYFTGKQASNRAEAGFVSLVGAAAVTPFAVTSNVMIIAAKLIIRLIVMFLPLIGTFAIWWRFRGALKAVGSIALAGVFNTVVFSAASAIYINFTTIATTSPDIPWWLGVTVTAIVGVVLWWMTKPLRRLTSMADPNNILGDAQRQMQASMKRARGFAATAAGAAVGGFAGGAAAARKTTADTEDDPEPQDDDVDPMPAPTVEQEWPDTPPAPTPSAAPAAPAAAGSLAGADDRAPTVAALPAGPTSGAPGGQDEDPAETYRPSPTPPTDDDAPTGGDDYLPTEATEADDSDVYVIYHPSDATAGADGGDEQW